MPAEAAFKSGLADFAAGCDANEHFSRDSLIQAAYQSGYDAARKQADRGNPLASPQSLEVMSRPYERRLP
jgi:hypothetical protein